nr:PEPxxWA-CTERM sorting domain-containing protein [Sandaracinobacteroides hominis]
MMKLNLAAFALLAAAVAAPAQAGLNGTTVSAVYNFPNYGDDYPFASESPGSFIVGAGVESTVNVEDVTFITVDFTDNGLTEPATWAMLIAGFGLVGGALRRRRPVAT